MTAPQHSPSSGYNNVFPLQTARWASKRIAATAVKVPALKAPTWTAYKGGLILAFADQALEANEERVHYVIQLPHAYKEGTDIAPHIHWVGEDGTAGDVVWKFTYSWANMEGAFPGETAITVTAANSVVVDTHNNDHFADISGTGKEIKSILLCTLQRNSNNIADTFTGKDAYLLEFDLHYQIDTVGSTQKLTK